MWRPLHKQYDLINNFNLYNFKSTNNNNNNNNNNTMNGFISKYPHKDKIDSINKVCCGLEIGHSSIQGYRFEMEDHYIIEEMKSAPNHILVAIMDGHCGDSSALFVSKNLINIIESKSQWREYIDSNFTNTDIVCSLLIECYCEIDNILRENKDKSGCTCVCCIITPTHIICASVGDSRCVIGSQGKTISMTEDHKPSSTEEKTRIYKHGGTVRYDRVNGQLAMSRALGDFQYKNNSNGSMTEQLVICIPDISIHERTNEDEVLLLACDGVWDVMSNDVAIKFIVEGIYPPNEEQKKKYLKIAKLEDNIENYQIHREESFGDLSSLELAENLVDYAFDLKSYDNISVLIAKLQPIENN